ncbi:hypothetical protein [Lysinibacillus sp. NPDC056232]|uniref:hypothetical protein n=1 Tax=Lysinibacillus sp. NPDC056232 TaxID=3345756 RepID=UPI0035DD277C
MNSFSYEYFEDLSEQSLVLSEQFLFFSTMGNYLRISATDETLQRSGSYLCESVAAATNVLSVRKRSVSDKCFICAKA